MKTPKPKPRGRNGGRKPLVAGGSDAWLRLRLPAAELQAIERAAKAAKQTLTAYVRHALYWAVAELSTAEKQKPAKPARNEAINAKRRDAIEWLKPRFPGRHLAVIAVDPGDTTSDPATTYDGVFIEHLGITAWIPK